MNDLALDRTARRILGVLVEKELTTPEQYPMSVNAIVNGANQKSNREPIMQCQEFEIEGALRSLYVAQWVTNLTVPGGRTLKWKHRFAERLGLDRKETAVLTELLLRGAQQPGELRQHAARMAPLPQIGDLEEVLASLAKKGLAKNLGRRPGERAPRYDHTLYPETEDRTIASEDREVAVHDEPDAPMPHAVNANAELLEAIESLTARIDALEARLDRLEGRG